MSRRWRIFGSSVIASRGVGGAEFVTGCSTAERAQAKCRELLTAPLTAGHFGWARLSIQTPAGEERPHPASFARRGYEARTVLGGPPDEVVG